VIYGHSVLLLIVENSLQKKINKSKLESGEMWFAIPD
jgi:hypothetical protein